MIIKCWNCEEELHKESQCPGCGWWRCRNCGVCSPRCDYEKTLREREAFSYRYFFDPDYDGEELYDE